MVDNGTEQALAAEAPTMTPAKGTGGKRERSRARELKCCPPRGVWEVRRLDRGLTQQSRAPPSAAARDSGQSAAGIEDMLGFANASPRAAAALTESHTRHMRMARLLKGAVLAADEAKVSGLLPLLVAARESALRQAGRKVSVKDVEDEDDEEVDRGIGAQAELPPGVPMWLPRLFLPRERTYTKRWQN
jgi:hypothetical protein